MRHEVPIGERRGPRSAPSCEVIGGIRRAQGINLSDDLEAFASGVGVAVTAFGEDKVGNKEFVAIRSGIPPFSCHLLPCKYGSHRVKPTGDMSDDCGFEVDSLHLQILPQITM